MCSNSPRFICLHCRPNGIRNETGFKVPAVKRPGSDMYKEVDVRFFISPHPRGQRCGYGRLTICDDSRGVGERSRAHHGTGHGAGERAAGALMAMADHRARVCADGDGQRAGATPFSTSLPTTVAFAPEVIPWRRTGCGRSRRRRSPRSSSSGSRAPAMLAQSGDLGWLTGPSTSINHKANPKAPDAGPRHGCYLSVWRRQPGRPLARSSSTSASTRRRRLPFPGDSRAPPSRRASPARGKASRRLPAWRPRTAS